MRTFARRYLQVYLLLFVSSWVFALCYVCCSILYEVIGTREEPTRPAAILAVVVLAIGLMRLSDNFAASSAPISEKDSPPVNEAGEPPVPDGN